MKYQAWFYQKSNEKIFKTVDCCSCDRRFNGYIGSLIYLYFTGYPNVGKSSVMNGLMGKKVLITVNILEFASYLFLSLP